MKLNIRKSLAGIAGCLLAFTALPASADGIRDNPLARFTEPLCPGVHGLSLETAEVMVTRMRSNVRELGIELAPAGTCTPNLIVAFVDDGQAYLERVNSETSRMAQLNRSEIRDLLSQPGPVRSWVTVEERTRDGMPVGVRENLVEIPQAKMWSAHSRIYVPTRRDISSATVLVDRDAAEGMTIGQMADIATLYGLTNLVPEATPSTPSIQHLFDEGGQAVDGLTAFDSTFLQRLYTLPPNLPASAYLQGLPGAAAYRE